MTNIFNITSSRLETGNQFLALLRYYPNIKKQIHIFYVKLVNSYLPTPSNIFLMIFKNPANKFMVKFNEKNATGLKYIQI